MNDERYILAELKRWLAGHSKDFVYAYEILIALAKVEADTVLGEPDEPVQEKEAE